MKKFRKVKSKTPLKKEEINLEYSDSISQTYKEKESENDYIYADNQQKKNLKIRNPDRAEILNKTLKVENKKIGIFKNEFKEEKSDNSSSRKKSKKKKVKKKKKSVKKDIIPEHEDEDEPRKKKSSGNNRNIFEDETPTPDGFNKFYLIDYHSIALKDINGVNEPNPIMTEDNYNTFHQNELEENNKEENIIDGHKASANTDKFRRSNFSSSSNTSYKFAKSHHSHRSTVNEKINPERLNFEIIKDIKISKNNNDTKNEKLRKLRFRKENDSKQEKLVINLNKKEKSKKDDDDIYEDNYLNNKEKENKRQSVHSKKKKMSKKKVIMKNYKVFLIQSIWRGYKIRKLIRFKKNLQYFCFLFDLLLNKRLKNNFWFFLEQIKLIYYDRNRNNKFLKEKNKRKFKGRRAKNFEIKSFDNLLSEKENSFNDLKDNNNIIIKNSLLEDKKLFISSIKDLEDEPNENYFNIKENTLYNNSDGSYFLKDSNINISPNKYHNNYENRSLKHNKDNNSSSKDKREIFLNNSNNKSKLKVSRIYKKAKGEKRNLSLSCDSLIGELSKKKYKKPEVKVPSIKTNFHKSIDISSSLNFNSVPFLNNDSNNMAFLKNQFTNDRLNNENNNDLSFTILRKRKASYHKKIISENSFSKTKNKKIKNDYSSIKFILRIKDIISNIIKKKNFYYIIGFLNIKSSVQNLMDIFQKRRNNIMKNILSELKCKIQVLKYLAPNNIEELLQKIKNKKKYISLKGKQLSDGNKCLFNENCIETNELSILVNSKKNKNNIMKNKNTKINKFQNNNLVIDKVIKKFCIKQDYIKENGFNGRKFKMEKNISKIKVEENQKIEKFNDNKLIISKIIPKINVIKQKKKNKLFIDKVIRKFNIKDKKKKNELIISKIIRESPFISMIKKSVQKNFINTSVINHINFNGLLINNNYAIDRVNSDYIIDDIDSYNKANKLKYYYSLIMNNINNLIISRIVSNFNIISKNNKSICSITNKEMHIKCNKNNNYIITKKVNDYILGNNSILKNLYKFNEKKLIITKVIKDYMLKMKGVNKNKKLIIYSTSLLKIKNILIKHIKNFIYPSLINIMKNYSFCYHMFNINKIKENEMRFIFIDNLRNKIFELKYKKLYSSNRFDDLIINKVIEYNFLNNNVNEKEDKNILDQNEINYNVEDNADKFHKRLKKNSGNQIPKHYMIHKDKILTINNDMSSGENSFMSNYEEKFLEKLYEKKNKYFIRGNVITKKIDIIIGNNNEQNLENKNTPIKEFPIYSPKEQNDKSKNKKKIFISKLKISNLKNFNNFNNINNNFKLDNTNNINNSNTINSINSINSNNTTNSNNTNNNFTFNSIIINSPKCNTFRSSNKMRKYFQINNSPSLYNEEENVIKRNIKEKKLNFDDNTYKDIQLEQRDLLKEKGKYIVRPDKEESEMESEKNEDKIIDKQVQKKKKENKFYFYKSEKIKIKYSNEKNFKKAKISYNDKKQFISEEEEEEEFEEEEEEIEFEDVKEILIKFISKKHNILIGKLLKAFQKWRKFKNNNSLMYSKNNNNFLRESKKYKRENIKELSGNDEINRSKRLFNLYRKYHNYSFMMKKIYLRKWRKLIDYYLEEKEYYEEEIEYEEEDE